MLLVELRLCFPIYFACWRVAFNAIS